MPRSSVRMTLCFISNPSHDPGELGIKKVQGCHWSRKSQGNSRSGKSQGILEYVREILNFVESQGNSRKVREI